MKFGPVPLAQAQGAILAHSVQLEGRRLRKGAVLGDADVADLQAANYAEITVAQLEADDIHEDRAAAQLAAALVPDPQRAGLRLSVATTGRVNIYSEVAGVVEIDTDKIAALNSVDPMITVATVAKWQRMERGGMVATVKIIAYGVDQTQLAKTCDAAAEALRMRPATIKRTDLIQTVIGKQDGAKGHRAIETRVAALGAELGALTLVPHEIDALSRAISASEAEVIFILTGSATSDIHDVAPEAVRRSGGEVHHFGMPVDPGNLLFLGEVAGRPVIGLPGCARSPALNGADWVLERVLCDVVVSAQDIQGMGVGGLLKEIPQRGRLRDPK